MAGRVAGKIKLQSVDELLGVPEIAGTQEIEIGRIHSFPNHPFKVLDDDKMESLVDSIRENGILNPVIVRPDQTGDYEMISGHRRLHAAGIVGLAKIPAIVKEMSDDEAIIKMVDAMNKEEYQTKAWPLPVSDLLYVGSATTKKLYSMGITTIGGLAQTDEKILIGRLGKMGSILWSFANGYDDSPVKIENTSAPVKSVGNSTTTPKDMETDEDVKIVLYILAESVAARLRENGFRCRTVEISIRDKDLYHFSKQVKLKNASNITKEIAEAGYRLYKENYRLPVDEYEKQHFSPEHFQKPLRSIGIRGTDLVTDYFWEQLDLFTDPGFREKQMKMDEAVDVIRRRFGFYSIQRGLMYRDRILSACDAKADHTVHPHGYFG